VKVQCFVCIARLLSRVGAGSGHHKGDWLLKKGIERYSKTDEGALYAFKWVDKDANGKPGGDAILGNNTEMPCPMHEDPLKLIPEELRAKVLGELNSGNKTDYKIQILGDLCPACRYVQREFMKRYKGDLSKVLEHVKVQRLILSEKDRIGIGTFQPKDEKNQDSTELTGDINYRKIAEYGSDSDPRAFNFDGEFNIANRGLIEFIEVLKLDVAFLYDGGWEFFGVRFDLLGTNFAILSEVLNSHLAVTAVRIVAFILKAFLLGVLSIQIRWTLPRFRYDQIMQLCWKLVLPLSLLNVLLTGIGILFFQ